MEPDLLIIEQAETELRLAERDFDEYEYAHSLDWTSAFEQIDQGEVEDEEEVDEEYKALEARVDQTKRNLDGLATWLGAFIVGEAKYRDALEKIPRYEAAIDRSLGRARDQLARLQRGRHDKATVQATVIDAQIEREDEPG